MSNGDQSDGLVSRSELDQLAEWFDAFEFALDPFSTHAKEAETKFNDQLQSLYESRVAVEHPKLPKEVFDAKVRTLCRKLIQKKKKSG